MILEMQFQSLLELVSMIEHDPDMESQLENGVTMSDQATAQLLQYNCYEIGLKDSDICPIVRLPLLYTLGYFTYICKEKKASAH